MSWNVEWHPAAELDLRRTHWREAERIARAMIRFADLGLGDVERVAEEASLLRLRASRSIALFSANRDARTLLVWRVVSR